jgi:hypothetical protein
MYIFIYVYMYIHIFPSITWASLFSFAMRSWCRGRLKGRGKTVGEDMGKTGKDPGKLGIDHGKIERN